MIDILFGLAAVLIALVIFAASALFLFAVIASRPRRVAPRNAEHADIGGSASEH